jgi:hypothetical protein
MPISTAFAGVNMRLEAGAIREVMLIINFLSIDTELWCSSASLAYSSRGEIVFYQLGAMTEITLQWAYVIAVSTQLTQRCLHI